MDEKFLLRMSFFISLAGVIILYFFSRNISVQEVGVNKIQQMKEDEVVRVAGDVAKITQRNKAAIIELSQNNSINVVVFDNIFLEKNQKIEVIGRIKDYEGKKEIVAQEIRLIG